MKVWISKYALTQGILEAEGQPSTSTPATMICESTGPFTDIVFPYFHGEGREWHRTEAEAKIKANEMVQCKIKSLEKQLAKLRKMVF